MLFRLRRRRRRRVSLGQVFLTIMGCVIFVRTTILFFQDNKALSNDSIGHIPKSEEYASTPMKRSGTTTDSVKYGRVKKEEDSNEDTNSVHDDMAHSDFNVEFHNDDSGFAKDKKATDGSDKKFANKEDRIYATENVSRDTLLPEKLFTVVGLESSGTTFMSMALARALRINNEFSPDHQETMAWGKSSSYYNNNNGSGVLTEVQHVPFPWGGDQCSEEKVQNILPIVYPWVCRTKIQDDVQDWKRCSDLIDVKTQRETSKLIRGGYLLNITSHFEWYRDQGVDAHLIIVDRDASIRREGRAKHCENISLLKLEEEEQIGMDIITHAMDKYILKNYHGDDNLEYPRSMRQASNSSSVLPSIPVGGGGVIASTDGKVIFVSYEMLNRFQDRYITTIYDYLGINSTFNPEWKDGNTKYVRGKVADKKDVNLHKSDKTIEGKLDEIVERRRELKGRKESTLKQTGI